MLHSILLMGVGFVVGAFTPSVGRRIKALFVSKTQGAVAAEASKVEAAVVAEVKSKL